MSAWRASIIGGCVWAMAGCGGGEIPKPQVVQQRVALQPFQGCEELETYIEDTAVLDMRTQLEQTKKGGWGWGFIGAPEAAAGDAANASASSSSGPGAYTTTNTQVAGVDEADFVKNDGTHIYVLSGQTLYVNQSWPANELKMLSRLDLEGWPQEMFFDPQRRRVVVFSSVYVPYPLDAAQGDVACDALSCGYGGNTLKVTVVDVADVAAPKVVDEVFLPGGYANSRRIDGSVRIVLSDGFRWPADVRWYVESQDATLYEDKARLEKAYDTLIAKNEQIIRAAALSDWLPAPKRRTADGALVEVAYECKDFYRSNAPTRLGLLTVATLNLDAPAPAITRTSIVAQSGEVYASAKSLYVASQHWWWWPEPGQSDHTYLHKFDLTQPDRAVYVASGGVSGHLVDQFSMDESAAGHLRVATTTVTRVEDTENPDNEWGRLESTNRVSVLGEQQGTLAVIGQSEELAKGERITSARFIGDKAFVVTFRNVDPLFTLDLSDPTKPLKIGELKIPGFSTYMHPLDEDHLLTIGTYVDEANDWQTRAVQLQIFDVSDLKNPRQTFTQKVGTAYGYSEAMWEHKAFNYFPEKKLLAIPFFDYDPSLGGDRYWEGFVSDLRVFQVDALTGFAPRGSLSMKDVFMSTSDGHWYGYWSPWIRRSVMADDFVYAISDSGIRVANIADLSAPVATVTFSKPAP